MVVSEEVPEPAVGRPCAPRSEPTLESPPLYDIVRDVNKLSNNVMARQIFLTLGATAFAAPATPVKSAEAVKSWLKSRKLSIPGLVLENGRCALVFRDLVSGRWFSQRS